MDEERDKRLREAADDEPEWPLGADIRSLLAENEALRARVRELEADHDAAVEEAADELNASIKAALMDEMHEHASTMRERDDARELAARRGEIQVRQAGELHNLRTERDRMREALEIVARETLVGNTESYRAGYEHALRLVRALASGEEKERK